MYGKRLVKRVGSLVIAAVIMASAFAVLPMSNEKAEAALMDTTPLVITEIMYNPAGDDAGREWIELYNMGDTELNLTGWTIKDAANNTFATLDVILGPYSYMVVNGSELNNNDNETIYIYNAIGEEVLNVSYDPTWAPDGHSIELGEDDVWHVGPEGGTPGMPNEAMTPPETTYSIAEEQMPWDWYVTNVTVTLNATDDTGVKETKYRVDGGDWNAYTEPFVISEPGSHLVEYYSIDVWGVEEEVKNFTVNIANTSSNLAVIPTEINWNETATVWVNNSQGEVSLYAPREDTPRMGPETRAIIRWLNVHFDVSGDWWVVDLFDGNANAAKIVVHPLSLDVNATPDETDFQKNKYVDIQGTVTLNGEAATQAKVKLIKPDGSEEIKDVDASGNFLFTLYLSPTEDGAGEYNITAFIGNETYPDAFGYDVVMINPIEPNITLVSNNAVGGFDIGTVQFEITDPADGLALLTNNYNISIYKGDELYAWYTPTEHGGPINFAISGKFLNLTSGMWEAGDYVINVSVDITGDGSWEYVGEASYTVEAAPPVNLKIKSPVDKKINVMDLANNTQIIQVQIFGENMTTYGTPEALGIGENNENVTERIKVEGDVLYSPPKAAYEYWKDGIWNITVFPTIGNGKIYINVTWPDKGEAGEVIDVVEGGYITVEPTVIVVDNTYTVNVTVKTKDQNPVTLVDAIQLYYEDPAYYEGTGWSLITEKTNEYSATGVFTFENFTADRAAINIVVAVKFRAPGETYAYARIISNPAHDLNVSLSPDAVLAGELTKFTVNITRNGVPYTETFEYYILNETELQKLHEGTLELPTPVYVGNKANDTFNFIETEPGTYYVYVRTQDKKHDNMENEPSFTVSKASVSVEPSLLVKNVDINVTLEFTVTWNGEPVTGKLLIHGLQEVASYEAYVENATYELDITNGTGTLENVSAIATGTLTFEFMSATEGSTYADADGSLEITTPTVEIVEPKEKVAFLAVENLITIVVKHPLTGNGIEGLTVEIITPTRADPVEVGKTDSNGKLIFGIVPLQTGKIKVLVEGEEAGEISIWVGLKIVMASEIEKDNEVTILVTTRGGKPVEGATVKVNGTTIGTTDANGEIKYKPTKEGPIKITAEKEGYYPAEKTVEVKKGAETPGFEFVGIAIAMALIALIYRRRK
ncbi:MAG: lamin tail domain-containing protein [Thermoplasmata archaeon]|nr:lamin tail domain-containing protein [Thermoplasmata archaeon]